MSVKHTNFYENLAEAQMRIRNTVVMYDGRPYYVQAVTDHKNDGVFRVYLEPLADAGKGGSKTPNPGLRDLFYNFQPSNPGLGGAIDAWLEKTKTATLLRKKMNSPLFNKFRPFPLGMMNSGEGGNGKCIYVERQPTRQTFQGLTANMLIETVVSCGEGQTLPGGNYSNILTDAFHDMITGSYPSAKECFEALMDSDVTNEALAFHRLFAFVRGPLDQIYLAYKDEIVALVPNTDFSQVKLGTRHRHLREAISELRLFGVIQ